MRNLVNLSLIIGVIVLFTACSGSQEKQQEKISLLEKELAKDAKPDAGKAGKLIDLYSAYVKAYPQDTICPEYLFRAANYSAGINNAKGGIDFLKQIDSLYPQSKRAGEAAFMQGFFYENYLNDLQNAGESYKQFIVKFPDHYMADDAAQMLKYLGNPEQMLKDFDSINKLAADTIAAKK